MQLSDSQRKKIIQAKIKLLEAAYQEFHFRLIDLKKEQDEMINKKVKQLDQSNIKKILGKIKRS